MDQSEKIQMLEKQIALLESIVKLQDDFIELLQKMAPQPVAFVGSYPVIADPVLPWYGDIPPWMSDNAGNNSFVAGKTIIIGTDV